MQVKYNINTLKLFRFICCEDKNISKLYADIEGYTIYVHKKNDYIIGVPKSNISNITLLAHLDTSLDYKAPRDIIFDKHRGVMFGEVAGDDRAGCYAIWDICKRAKYKPYFIIFNGEERGSLGAASFISGYEDLEDKINIDVMKTSKFLIAFDRKGEDDAVYYTTDNAEFEKFINDFGFKTSSGTYSDIKMVESHFKICGVNLSVGYKNCHSKEEYLFLSSLSNTINKAINIVDTVVKGKIEKFKYIEKKEFVYVGYDYGFKGYNLGFKHYKTHTNNRFDHLSNLDYTEIEKHYQDNCTNKETERNCYSCYRSSPECLKNIQKPEKEANGLYQCNECKQWINTNEIYVSENSRLLYCKSCMLLWPGLRFVKYNKWVKKHPENTKWSW